ncbi:hypothetical protein [Actinocrispum sp. NPDC049592]|uniref:hypothetical protein n=1 Tax=Actinocrispum sp. NPDC049592 TaxID=3154835 RepID=UPI0034157850
MIEFIGEPFDPRQLGRAAAVPAVSTLLAQMREMIVTAHASALDTQSRLQRRFAPGGTI